MNGVDRIALGILADHCQAAAESMAHALFRTAYSTFVKETEDFTTGLADAQGRTFASPRDLGATWFTGLDYGNVVRAIPEYRPGDICITNDPYSGFVCTHSPDLHMWKPVFAGDELVCFAVSHVHNTDVGGAVPASLSRSLTEVHQEGIRLPPFKLFDAGRLDERMLQVLLTNVRVPEQNWGDLKAQIACANTGERKVLDMIAHFGLDAVRTGIDALLDLSDRQARAIIAGIPDGEYEACDYIDEDSPGGPPCRIALRLSVRGDEVVLDFTGSDPQLRSALNVPTGGQTRHVLMMIGLNYVLYSLDPSLRLNSGVNRCARCILPEGSIVNPAFPAAVGMRSLTTSRVMGVVIAAFSRALPQLLPAGTQGGSSIVNLRTARAASGKVVMASVNPITGGAGASARGDGADGSGGTSGFLKNTPVEIAENEIPVRIRHYRLAPDSGGPGQYRGGLATALEFEVLNPESVVTARNRDRSRFAAWGIAGGQAGGLSTFTLQGESASRDLGNTDVVNVDPGDVLAIVGAGGGGWGDPRLRDPEAVLADVSRGWVSPAAARAEYGVAIADGAVDAAATAALRAAPSAPAGHFSLGAARLGYERDWTAANYAALTAVLAGIPVTWRFFIKHRIFAAVAGLAAQRGDGSDVHAAFAELRRRHPQIAG